MRIIDAHHHLWDPSAVGYVLLQPAGPLAPLARQFRSADFDAVARANGVADAIVVEAASAGADIDKETNWILAQIAPSRVTRRFVACVPVESPDVAARLDALLARAGDRVVGIRRSFESGEPESMLRPEIAAGIRRVAERGLAFDLVLFADRLGEAVELVRRVPEARFVLDHLGKPPLARTVPEDWRRNLSAMAALRNVVA
jgi:L-fuconolactonase